MNTINLALQFVIELYKILVKFAPDSDRERADQLDHARQKLLSRDCTCEDTSDGQIVKWDSGSILFERQQDGRLAVASIHTEQL